jgi:peptidoglycan L-alanyl-D-glutamate endopeptidase CwlK
VSARLEDLITEARVAAEKMLAHLDAEGLAYFVSETLRTVETQRAYYAQGRRGTIEVNALRSKAGLAPIQDSANNGTITNCDGDEKPSPHQSGRAIDIYPVIGKRVQWSVGLGNLDAWKALGEAGELAGLEWGGRWKPFDRYGIGWDAPHFQIKE